jgi:uncharacterized membrane protein
MRRMSPQEWVGLAVRWAHLIAGIAWIGSSFYFIWLDSHLEPADPARATRSRRLAVDGALGRLLRVQRKKIGPGRCLPSSTGSSGRR